MQSNLVDVAAQMFDDALQWHTRFDLEIWNKPSFHNEGHLRAVWSAAKLILDTTPDNDFLGLRIQQDRWNTQSAASMSNDEFSLLVKIAVSLHDLGNIMDEQGNLLKFYTSADSEARSSKLVTHFLAETLEPTHIELINYLIAQTDFGNKATNPWARFMMIIDQLSSGYFRDNMQALRGLMEERLTETPKAIVIPDREVNFTYYRERVLLSATERQELWNIWAVEPVIYRKGYGKREMPIEVFIRQLDTK